MNKSIHAQNLIPLILKCETMRLIVCYIFLPGVAKNSGENDKLLFYVCQAGHKSLIWFLLKNIYYENHFKCFIFSEYEAIAVLK